MTLPLPGEPTPAAASRTASDRARERSRIARKWAYLATRTTYVPLPQNELERELAALFDVMVVAVTGDRPGDIAAAVGTRLVELHCVGHDCLRNTVEVLGKSLLAQPELQLVVRLGDRVVSALAGLTASYLEATQQSVLDQQHAISAALNRAAQGVQRNLRVSEARFEQVFATSAGGIAITDLDGRFVRTNEALCETLHRTDEAFAELTIFDLAPASDGPALRDAYRGLLAGDTTKVSRRQQLVRRDGELVPTSLAVSLLRDADGAPTHFVTIVQDDSEVTLLLGQLNQQALHDALTGLPNRQFFTSQLETVLHQATPETTTLYHLDLDAFALITNGLGRAAGDRLLKQVADRLTSVFVEKKAMVARVGGDEFAVLVQDSASTQEVEDTATRINEELSEPLFANGKGVAASASIGIVHHPPAGIDAGELLRAADSTLRRTQRSGHRQWSLFHPEQDRAERARFDLAATMPGAWEIGEIHVVYQPIVRLDDRRLAGIEALLRWEHPEFGAIEHDRCVELAESTGLILPLGQWLLRSAAEQLLWWHEQHGCALPLRLGLTPNQSCDPDLVRWVLDALSDTGMRAQQLELAMPAQTLLTEDSEAAESLKALADTGILVAADGLGSAGDLACLEDLPIRSTRIAGWLVKRLAQPNGRNGPLARALPDLVSLAHEVDVTVDVADIRAVWQADWWRQAGVDNARGPLFADAGAADCITPMLG
ncbi:diguanylate cyclase [Solihabitans fulvus]|uniref:Diguanylate cyclase n=1 Tax=Solihabitans fulvus TaxID=1892852 RepID=A0A5B2WXQ4_9PSEU|nr:EAL domain-containing protein [Solihabitans fulvus]KAA2255472.1 diguanylate cyclase [Solihabitans fulvus]